MHLHALRMPVSQTMSMTCLRIYIRSIKKLFPHFTSHRECIIHSIKQLKGFSSTLLSLLLLF